MKHRLERNRTRRHRVIAMVAMVSTALLGCGEELSRTDASSTELTSEAVITSLSAPSGGGARISHGFGPCGDCNEHQALLMSDFRSNAHRWALALSPDAGPLGKTNTGGYSSSEATYLWRSQGIAVTEDGEGFVPDHEPAAVALMRDLPVDAMAAAREEANELGEALRRALAEELEDRLDDWEVGDRHGIDGFSGNGGPVGAGPCADCMYVFVKPDDVIVEMERLRAVGKIEIEFASAVDGRLIRITLRSPPAVLLRDESGNVWLRFEVPLSAVEKLPISGVVRIGGELRVDTRDAEDQAISFETRPQPMDAQRRDAGHDRRIDRARLPRPVGPTPGDDF